MTKLLFNDDTRWQISIKIIILTSIGVETEDAVDDKFGEKETLRRREDETDDKDDEEDDIEEEFIAGENEEEAEETIVLKGLFLRFGVTREGETLLLVEVGDVRVVVTLLLN